MAHRNGKTASLANPRYTHQPPAICSTFPWGWLSLGVHSPICQPDR